MLAECVERPRNPPQSEQIFRLSRLLGQRFGFERSFKLSRGGVDASRFLISASLEGVSRAALTQMFEALKNAGIPAVFAEEMERRIGDARFIHFGYEEGEGRPVCKTYLEFDPQGAGDERPLVHASFKWEMRSPARCAADEYRRMPSIDAATLRALVDSHAARLAPSDAPLGQASKRMIDLVLSRSSADELYVLEVRRRNGERISYDVRTYELGCRVADIAPLIQPLTGADHFANYLREHEEATLGHVAFGTGNDGRAFLTAYHGGAELA